MQKYEEKLKLDKDIQNCFSFLGDEVLSYGNVETHTLGSTSGIGHISRLTGEATVYEVKTKNDVYKIYIGIVLICDDEKSKYIILNMILMTPIKKKIWYLSVNF